MKLGTIQQSWLNALKSGNYRQMTGQLSCKNVGSKSTNCCLGVYCRVFNRLHPNVIKIEDDGWAILFSMAKMTN